MRALRGPLGTGAALVLAWFAATMGWVLVTGGLPAPLAAIGAAQPLATALGLFVAGAGVALALVWLGTVVLRRRPA